MPIALERVEKRPRMAVSGPMPARQAAPANPRVLIGMDGSMGSQEALVWALDVLGAQCGVLILAKVVHFDATDDATRSDIAAATQRLASSADHAEGTVGVVNSAVLAGPPAEALR